MNKRVVLFLSLLFGSLQTKCADWMLERINKDLACFSAHPINQQQLTKFSKTFLPNSCNVAHFSIKKGIVVLKKSKKTLSYRAKYVKQFLDNVVKKYSVPNVDFIVILNDGYTKKSIKSTIPLFVFSKHELCNNGLVLMPDAVSTYCSRDLISVIAACNWRIPFERRMPRIIWRGATTGFENKSIILYRNNVRFKLVALSEKYPQLLDAKFSGFDHGTTDALKIKLRQLDYLAPYMSLEEQQCYQYQILVDGYTASWKRAYWQLWTDSLIFKQESTNIQWYYEALIPYKHYVPIDHNVSDVIEKIKWARANPKKVHTIITNANTFAHTYLTYEAMMYYMYLLLIQYKKIYTV